MKRREFITLLGGAAAWPLAAYAQDGRTYRIGVLNANPRGSPLVTALFDELRRNGLVEGRNLVIDGSGIGIPYPRFPDAARELAKAKVEALVVGGGGPPIRSVQAVAPGIPIIGVADDMVAAGLAQSLVQPGGNVTGVSLFAPELDGKRLELLIELLPGVRRMAAFGRPEGTVRSATAGASGSRARPRCRAFDPSGDQRRRHRSGDQRCESRGRGWSEFARGVIVWQQSQSDHRAH